MADIVLQPVAGILESTLWPLLVEHREELTTNKTLMVLRPDVARYAAAERAGALFSLVAWDGSTPVGYSINFIGPNLHYSDLRVAHNDVLFVDKSHRAMLGVRLIRETIKAARTLDARMMVWHAKPGTPLEAIMRKRGARVQDILFTEEL